MHPPFPAFPLPTLTIRSNIGLRRFLFCIQKPNRRAIIAMFRLLDRCLVLVILPLPDVLINGSNDVIVVDISTRTRGREG